MPHTISYVIPSASDGQTVQTFLRRDCGMSWRMVVKLKRVENGIMLDGVHVRTIDLLKAGPIRKAKHRRIDAFELWCWRRLLRVPWTAGRSNKSILKEVSPEYSLEGLKLKLQCFGHLM